MVKMGNSHYIKIRLLLNDIIKDYSQSWADGDDTLCLDKLFIKLRRLSSTLTDAIHIMNSME